MKTMVLRYSLENFGVLFRNKKNYVFHYLILILKFNFIHGKWIEKMLYEFEIIIINL